jgi:lipopolysaccharide heptosyltransferase I
MMRDRIEYKDIAIIKLSSLGDIIHTLPAFSLLRRSYPLAKIYWIVSPQGAKLLKNFLGIDELIIIDLKKKGVLNKLKEVNRIRSRYKNRFDLILDFQGLFKSSILAWLLKSKSSYGFHKKDLREPLSHLFMKENIGQIKNGYHVSVKNLFLVNEIIHLSPDHFLESRTKRIKWNKIKIGLRDLSPEKETVTNFLRDNQLKIKNFLILNVGGGWETKILHKNQYVTIINKVKRQAKVVILWGNEQEKKLAKELAEETGVLIADFFNFSQLIAFIGYSRVIITGDTMALHLADLVNTPSVGIFGPTSPQRNGSLLEKSVAIYKKLHCSFCYKKKCGTIQCLKELNVSEIVKSVKVLYKNG